MDFLLLYEKKRTWIKAVGIRRCAFIIFPLVTFLFPTRETHWSEISLMAPSHILALHVTTIFCVYGDMDTKLLITLCMSTQPILIHATDNLCGILQLVSVQYSTRERGGGGCYVYCMWAGEVGCACACERVSVCLLVCVLVGGSIIRGYCVPQATWM